MNMNWKFKVFRNAEGEGAGGAAVGGATEDGGTPAPDRMSALEQRLERLSGSLESQTRNSQRDETMRKIASKAGEFKQAVAKTSAAVDTAEQTLAAAYEDGEGAEIAKAQRSLTEAVAAREHAKSDEARFTQQVEQAQKQAEAKPQGSDLDDTNLKGWKDKHSSWYGVDAEMTKASHEIDRQIRDAGVLSVGSREYFEAVDRAMGQKFPDRLSGTPPTTGDGGQRMQPQSRQKGKIQQSIADGWRRMGINVDDPETVDRMLKHRQTAVDKGILNAAPAQGRIIQR